MSEDIRDVCVARIHEFLREYNYTSPWIRVRHIDPFLIQRSSLVKIRKDTLLFQQGESDHCLYVVKSGRIRVAFLSKSGDERCVYIAEEGAFLGEEAVLGSFQHNAAATAIKDVWVYRILVQDIESVIREHPHFICELMQSLSHKLNILHSHLEYDSKNALARIAASLLALSAQYGQFNQQSACISIRFTHEELANLNNLNRVTVSKGLRKLALAGVIETISNRMIIHDFDMLMEIVSQSSN